MLSPNDRYRKRKGDEWRLVDVAMLPPLENVDPDRLKLFSKDEIRSYLRHYDMTPAETKPDMKRQLRSLISGIKSGTIRRLEGIGSKLNSVGLHQATFSGAIQSPLSTVSSSTSLNVDYKDYYLNKQGSGLNVGKYKPFELTIHDIKDNVVPDNNHNQLAAKQNLSALGMDGLHMGSQSSDDLTCVSCGKRSNKECKFKRCKNCCNAALLKCGVHARHISLLPGQVLSSAPDDSDRLTIISGGQASNDSFTPYQVPQKSYDEDSERELGSQPDALLVDPDEEAPTDQILHRTTKRMKTNLECIAEIFNTENVSSLEQNLNTVPMVTAPKESVLHQLETEKQQCDSMSSSFEEHKKLIQETYRSIFENPSLSDSIMADHEEWLEPIRQTIRPTDDFRDDFSQSYNYKIQSFE